MTPAELIARAQAAAAANRQSLMRRTADARILDRVKIDTTKAN